MPNLPIAGKDASDHELLKLAAKAAGCKWRWFGVTFCIEHDAELSTYRPWNPLTDDGDALRLAVKLRLHVDQHRNGGVDVWVIGGKGAEDFCENSEDPCAATRRAIVRAAAAIGAGKPASVIESSLSSGVNVPAVDLTKPHWRCVCGTVAMPLTDEVVCKCADIYEQEWTRIEPAGVSPAHQVTDPRCI